MMYAHGDVPEPIKQTTSTLNDIPIRNVWLLFLYASGLAQFRDQFQAAVDTSPDFKSLIARLLCFAVDKRLRRNLSFGYQRREEAITRVRGRIDILKTASGDLLKQGLVACRFEELTIDTPRNRFVRAALSKLAGCLDDRDLRHRCRSLAGSLDRIGVAGGMPSRAELATDQIARHQQDDRLMVSLAQAVFDLILPTESAGSRSLLKADRDETEFRWLFEKAVGNFFAAELSRDDGWRVYPGKQLAWPVTAASEGIQTYLPIMETDIILENAVQRRRIIIDTKFTNILTRSQYSTRFKTGHIYQLYAYLRSQERPADPLSMQSEGLLLYPTIGLDIDETAVIQGHAIRFATIDLARSTSGVIEALRALPARRELGDLLTSTQTRQASENQRY